MGVFNRDYPEGHPNAKMYHVCYADGDQFTFHRRGHEPVRAWNLAGAIAMANIQTDPSMQLFVVDPATSTVLWAGEVAMR